MEFGKGEVTVVDSKEGKVLKIAGGSYRIVISGEQTGGTFAVIEMTVPPGAGPNPHAHPDFEESFFVLEGEVYFKSESGNVLAKKDGFIHIPKGGKVHGFKNLSNEPAKLLCTVIPAGLDAFFQELSDFMELMKSKQIGPDAPEVKAGVAALFQKYGQSMYAPDYLD